MLPARLESIKANIEGNALAFDRSQCVRDPLILMTIAIDVVAVDIGFNVYCNVLYKIGFN